jgi:tripartite-type tricarboxylate transporter receptor subunit TctC
MACGALQVQPGGDAWRRLQRSERFLFALVVALKDPAVRTSLKAQGDEVSYNTPKDFAAFVNAGTTKWTKVVRTADLQLG